MPAITHTPDQKLPQIPLQVRRVQGSDLALINQWLEGYEQNPISADILPEVGFIFPGTAAGFLYRAESGLGFIEHLVGNPSAWPTDRDRALDKVVEELVRVAPIIGIKHLIGFTQREAVAQRALKHGFTIGGQNIVMVVKEVKV